MTDALIEWARSQRFHDHAELPPTDRAYRQGWNDALRAVERELEQRKQSEVG